MNPSTFNNVALFIKRSEEYQTKEFIVEVFDLNNIGKVRDVKFIKKHNELGKSYNSAIVIFEHWNMNRLVQTLFSEMAASPDGTTKFYFEPHRYWFINVHKQKLADCEETASVDPSLSDKEKIRKLEELVKSMSAQIFYMQNKHEKTERAMMDSEQKHTRHHLINVELQWKLEEKDIERKIAEDELKTCIEKLREENEILRCQSAFMSVDMVRKEARSEQLEQELQNSVCIIRYFENQTQEMKRMLDAVSDMDPIKQVVSTYVEEHFE